jgi:methylated-DNA-[protein]-cysteine S-methyltransferase
VNGTPAPTLARALRQLDRYFAGEPVAFDLPLAPAGTSFQQRVWAAMRAIPHGETVTYGELARASVPAQR